jgi:hypothetical protein
MLRTKIQAQSCYMESELEKGQLVRLGRSLKGSILEGNIQIRNKRPKLGHISKEGMWIM